jgi:hypothetical protein
VPSNVDHLAGGRILLPIEHHADNLVDRADGGEKEDCRDEPFESTHGSHHPS